MYTEILDEINNKLKIVKDKLSEMHVQDIADLLEQIDNPKDLIKVFKVLPKDVGAEVFSYASSDVQEALVVALSDKELGYIIEEMYIDDAVDFIEEMPANIVERILKNSTPKTRQQINQFLGYEENSAGSIMTPEFIDVRENTTINNCLQRIRRIGADVETINIVYVTDKTRILKGVLSIRELLLSDGEAEISEIMNDNVIFAETTTDREEVVSLFRQYNLLALPIVDKEQRLVGIITVDDIVDVIEEESTEDISIMAATTPNEKPYLKTSPFRLWLNRAPWLLLLMISATFTGLVISKNEALLSNGIYGILLTACIPMIMGTGGNAGGQSSATIIRGIALDEIEFKDLFKVMFKEFIVGVLLGLTISVACFGKIMLIDGMLFKTQGVDYMSALIISLAMFITIVIAKLVGCLLPILAKKCKLDPAVMASPFITTILDTVSLLVYCGLALTFLY